MTVLSPCAKSVTSFFKYTYTENHSVNLHELILNISVTVLVVNCKTPCHQIKLHCLSKQLM